MDLPHLSIIIVTSDRVACLQRCLRELHVEMARVEPGAAEVLTVHAPNDDDAMRMVRSEFPGVAVHATPVRNISVQRNAGARLAHGDVIVYLDDDAWPCPGWLTALRAAFAGDAVVAASGPVLEGDGSLQCGPRQSSPLGRVVPTPDLENVRPGMAPTLPGCNFAIRREALFAAGGFDENLTYHDDDVDLCRRLFARAQRRPGAIVWRHDARIHHVPAPGPFRRTLHDRAWFTVARDTVYFGFRHAGWPRALACSAILQLPKLARFGLWLGQGKLGFGAFLRCAAKQIAGTCAGYWKGLSRGPRLPLSPLPAAAAAAPIRVGNDDEAARCRIPERV